MTRPLFGRIPWSRARSILRVRRLLIGLDVDGTLAPLVPKPDQARVPAATLRAIRRALRAPDTRIAILSARPGRDLRRLLPVGGVIRIAQYGLEGPLAPAARVLARARRGCLRITRALRPRVKAIPGALLEPKGLTVAVHTRNVTDSGDRRALLSAVREIARRVAREEGFVTMPGAEIVDFVPRGHDKGRALRALRRTLRPGAVVYFGDSGGDEPAFASLKPSDLPVRVGRGSTGARYRVEGLRGVTRFLDAVTDLRGRPA